MALKLDQVRALAERVAASHGLDVVDVEYAGGGGKHRTLRVFIEKDEAGRARLRAAIEKLNAEQGGEEAGEAEVAAGAGSAGGAGSQVAEFDPEWLEALPEVGNLEYLSGVTHEDCEQFSRDFGTVLDVEDLVPGTEYLLEVSSPGLDRKLSSAKDFERFTGSLVKLDTFEPVDGRKKWQGRVAGCEGGVLKLQLDEGKGGKGKGKKAKAGVLAEPVAQVEIAVTGIERATLVPEF